MARLVNRWSVAASFLSVLAIATLCVGVVSYAHAREERTRAANNLARANSYAESVETRLRATRRDSAALKRKLASTKAARTRLQLAEADGFPFALERGHARGERAGMAAGKRAGSRAARMQRNWISAPGWYMAHVAWRNGLPVIDDSYELDAGPSHAYWVENGEAWERETG